MSISIPSDLQSQLDELGLVETNLDLLTRLYCGQQWLGPDGDREVKKYLHDLMSVAADLTWVWKDIRKPMERFLPFDEFIEKSLEFLRGRGPLCPAYFYALCEGLRKYALKTKKDLTDEHYRNVNRNRNQTTA